jgi:anti-sigma factor RsiW
MRTHVTHLLTAYVHDELPPHLNRRVIRHLERCDDCYLAMQRERDLARTLAAQMPAIGVPHPEQLARLLPAILADVNEPPSRRQPRLLPGYGLALVATLVLAVMVPTLVVPRVVADYAPNQPAPYMIQATATQSVTDSPVAGLVSPTAIARRNDSATEPPVLDPAPAPVALATPGR